MATKSPSKITVEVIPLRHGLVAEIHRKPPPPPPAPYPPPPWAQNPNPYATKGN
jgi:hypothetical protein